MNKPRPILVVVEHAQDAAGLIRKALVVARQLGARVELFLCESEQAYQLAHAYDQEGIEQARAQSIAQARDYLANLKACAGATDVEITIDAVCESPLYEAVVRKALRSTPALVIKGLGAQHARRKRTADPNDWQLMRTCPATLMLTRRSVWHVPPRFAAAVDVSEHEIAGLPQHVLQTARTLASPWHGILEVVYGEAGVSAREAHSRAARLHSLCDAGGIAPQGTHVLSGPPEQSLTPFAQQRDYDVMVLGALTHRPASTALVGTLTSKLLDDLECDFVLVKPPGYRCPIEDGRAVAMRAPSADPGTAAVAD